VLERNRFDSGVKHDLGSPAAIQGEVRDVIKRRAASALIVLLVAGGIQSAFPSAAWAAGCTPHAGKPFRSSSTGNVIGNGTVKCDRAASFQWKLQLQKKISGSWTTVNVDSGNDSVQSGQSTFGAVVDGGDCQHNSSYRDVMSINNGAKKDTSNAVTLC
jgi:hypothetical protein